MSITACTESAFAEQLQVNHGPVSNIQSLGRPQGIAELYLVIHATNGYSLNTAVQRSPSSNASIASAESRSDFDSAIIAVLFLADGLSAESGAGVALLLAANTSLTRGSQ